MFFTASYRYFVGIACGRCVNVIHAAFPNDVTRSVDFDKFILYLRIRGHASVSHRCICISDRITGSPPAPYATALVSLFCRRISGSKANLFPISVVRSFYHLLICRGGDKRDLPCFAALGRLDFHIFECNFIDL